MFYVKSGIGDKVEIREFFHTREEAEIWAEEFVLGYNFSTRTVMTLVKISHNRWESAFTGRWVEVT